MILSYWPSPFASKYTYKSRSTEVRVILPVSILTLAIMAESAREVSLICSSRVSSPMSKMFFTWVELTGSPFLYQFFKYSL